MNPEEARAAWDEYALVGRIARAHGNRGQVIVNPDTDFVEERFRVGSILRTWRDGRSEELRVTAYRLHLGRPVIALEGVETMDDAEAMAASSCESRPASWRRCPRGPSTGTTWSAAGSRRPGGRRWERWPRSRAT